MTKGTVAGANARMQRLIAYWAVTILLYILSLSILWIEVRFGSGIALAASIMTGLVMVGQPIFFIIIWNHERLGLTTAQLSLYQAQFAIVCTGIGYTALGPLRGASLIGFFVILVFCAFSLSAKASRALSLAAIAILGVTMAAMPIIAPQFFDLKMELIHFTLTGAMLLVVGILTGRLTELRTRLKQQREELQAAVERIRVLATTDALTTLPNRCCMAEVLQHHEKRRATMSGNACIALLDIDWFKKINDRFGHDAGDTVLKQFAQLGRRELRENDVLARWGGEEFLLYLPSTGLAAAHSVVERLRRRLESATLQVDGQQITVTLSAGLVELQPGEPVNDGLRRADKLLYRAKANGRNQVVAEQNHAEAGCASKRRLA